jgi:hypothetical protein
MDGGHDFKRDIVKHHTRRLRRDVNHASIDDLYSYDKLSGTIATKKKITEGKNLKIC